MDYYYWWIITLISYCIKQCITNRIINYLETTNKGLKVCIIQFYWKNFVFLY